MLCKVCQTRLDEDQMTCPACGHVVGAKGRGKEKTDRPTSPPARSRKTVHLDLDLDDEAEVEEAGAGLEDVAKGAMAVQKEPDTSPPPVFTLDPAGLRKLIARQPELLEAGLSVLTDEKGKPVGAGYCTDVGNIDLLARDRSGGIVVVTVAERGEGEELVAAVLQRIGWVRKHLGKKQKVRGLVLMADPPEDLTYAAAAVADTVAFKTYRVALTIDDVDV